MKRLLAHLPTGSIVLTLTTFASYGAGLLRDRVFAHSFGASRSLDAYNAAFLLPDLLFNILIASGIAAAFVPIVTALLKQKPREAEEYVGTVITSATASMALSALLIILFATPVSALIAPGFSPADQALVAHLLRLLAFSPLFFSISNALGALLIVKQRFLTYGLSPLLYNIGIIAGTLVLAPTYGIYGAVWGTLLGATLHLAVRVVGVGRTHFRLKLAFFPRREEFRRTLRLMLPKMFGHPVELGTFWAFTIIASHLEAGSVAVLNFARNFESVPVSLIGITLATTTFPLLSTHYVEKDFRAFRQALMKSLWLIGVGSVGAAVLMFLIREPLIRLTLGGGAFNEGAIVRTATLLGVFTLAMPTESLVHLLARAFYATKNTLIPVLLSLLGLALSVGFGLLLSPRLGLEALPLSFFIASFVEVVLLLIFLLFRLEALKNGRLRV